MKILFIGIIGGVMIIAFCSHERQVSPPAEQYTEHWMFLAAEQAASLDGLAYETLTNQYPLVDASRKHYFLTMHNRVTFLKSLRPPSTLD